MSEPRLEAGETTAQVTPEETALETAITREDNAALAQVRASSAQSAAESGVLPKVSIEFKYVFTNFDNLDESKDGKITKEEIDKYIKNSTTLKPEEAAILNRVGDQINDLKDLADDKGSDDGITKGDLNVAHQMDKAMDYAQNNFDRLDGNGDGKISDKELDAYSRARGDKLSGEELAAINVLKVKMGDLADFSDDSFWADSSFTRNDLMEGRRKQGTGTAYTEPSNGESTSAYSDLRPALDFAQTNFDALDADKDGFISKGEIGDFSESNKDQLSSQEIQNLKALRERVDKVKDLSDDESNKGVSINDIAAAKERIDALSYAQKNFDKLDGNGDSYVTAREIERHIRISGNELTPADLNRLETLKKMNDLKDKHYDTSVVGFSSHDVLDAMEELGSGGVKYGEPITQTPPTEEPPEASDTPPDPVDQPGIGDPPADERPDAAAQRTHTVERGDTLWKICKGELRQRNSGAEPTNAEIVSLVREMARINNLANPDLIRPGDILKFPVATANSVPMNTWSSFVSV